MPNNFNLNIAQPLQGLQGVIGEHLGRQQQAGWQEEAAALYESGDLQALAKFSIAHPEMGQQIREQTKHKNATTEAIRRDVFRKIMISGGKDHVQTINDGAEAIRRAGGDPSDMLKVADMPQEEALRVTGLTQAVQFGADSIAIREHQAGKAPIKLGQGDRLLDPTTYEELVAAGGDNKNALKITEEARKDYRTRVNNIGSEAGVIATNFNKLTNLVVEIKKGNRSAVAQGMIALVKIGDPGSIVKESEMIAALNKTDPVAAVTKLFLAQGVGDDVARSVIDKIDPLDPFNINTEELLATANAMINANIPSLQGRFQEVSDLAKDNLTDAGYKTIFNKGIVDRIAGLTTLSQALGGNAPQPQQIAEGATATNASGQKIIFTSGQWVPNNG